jgi:hypothetical protein
MCPELLVLLAGGGNFGRWAQLEEAGHGGHAFEGHIGALPLSLLPGHHDVSILIR